MTDRRFPLYLRVAGELVVIVTGVLLALWVDNLNQDRREAEQVEAYLSGMLVDLRSDSLELANRRETATRSVAAADSLLGLYRRQATTVATDSLATWIFYTAFVDNFQVLDHTYRQILGAGGLSLIPDDEVRRQIAAYYRSIESADFFTDYYKKEEEDFWDLLEGRLHPEDFEGVSRISDQPASDTRFQADRVLRQLRTDHELINAIQVNRHWTALRLSINERRIRMNADLAAALRGAPTR